MTISNILNAIKNLFVTTNTVTPIDVTPVCNPIYSEKTVWRAVDTVTTLIRDWHISVDEYAEANGVVVNCIDDHFEALDKFNDAIVDFANKVNTQAGYVNFHKYLTDNVLANNKHMLAIDEACGAVHVNHLWGVGLFSAEDTTLFNESAYLVPELL